MDTFRGCKSFLERMPAQIKSFRDPLEVLLGDHLNIKSIRGILYDEKTLKS